MSVIKKKSFFPIVLNVGLRLLMFSLNLFAVTCVFHRLRTEMTTAQTDWERYMSQTSNEMVGKNTELITSQNRIGKLQAELERSREEINRLENF